MKIKLLMLGIACASLLISCKKTDKRTCTAMTANGMAMYEIQGFNNCDSQIDKSTGDYCACECDSITYN
jgi:hypothetical protein